MTDEELPLYLTYRELAVNELTRRLTALGGEGAPPPDPKLDAEALTKLYFDAIDKRRTALWDDEMKAAADLAAQGKWDEVAKRYDAILIDDPMFAKRGEMVAGYHEAGKAAAARNDWDAAVALFHKAHSIDPQGAKAKESEAKLHWARAMRARAAGKNGDDDLARALEADPTLDVARDAASSQARARVQKEKGWMLYAGIASGVVALGLIIIALAKRRRTAG
jgi:tetratricopeptide (TPR) repeat protein